MTKKHDYSVKMFDHHGNTYTDKIPAASAEQALMSAMNKSDNARYIDFGVVGDDGGCHIWKTRPGYKPTSRGRLSTMANSAPSRTSRSPVPARDPHVPEPPPKSGPMIVGKAEINKLFEVAARALSQVSAKDTFTARSFKEKLPLAYQPMWMPGTWPKVLSRLLKEHAIIKPDHFNYRRVEGYVAPKEEPPVEKAAATPPVVEVAPAVSPPAIPPAPSMPSADPIISVPFFNADDKVEFVLRAAMIALADTRARETKFKALSDRLMGALEQVEGVRTDLEAFMKAEAALPSRMQDILGQLRSSAPTAAAPPPIVPPVGASASTNGASPH